MRFLPLFLLLLSGCATAQRTERVPDHFQIWTLELEGTRNYENLSTLAE